MHLYICDLKTLIYLWLKYTLISVVKMHLYSCDKNTLLYLWFKMHLYSCDKNTLLYLWFEVIYIDIYNQENYSLHKKC